MFFTMHRQAHASDAIRARLSDVVLSGTRNLLSHPREESFTLVPEIGTAFAQHVILSTMVNRCMTWQRRVDQVYLDMHKLTSGNRNRLSFGMTILKQFRTCTILAASHPSTSA
jgi:hypothetical protein